MPVNQAVFVMIGYFLENSFTLVFYLIYAEVKH